MAAEANAMPVQPSTTYGSDSTDVRASVLVGDKCALLVANPGLDTTTARAQQRGTRSASMAACAIPRGQWALALARRKWLSGLALIAH